MVLAGRARRLFWAVVLLCAAAAVRAPARAGDELDPVVVTAAPELRAAWLRYHELELCQTLDATFSLDARSLEAWCVVDDEKSYQKLIEILEPLRASFDVTLYATRPAPEKEKEKEKDKKADEKNPPPSLWNNGELREYLQDPFTRGGGLVPPIRVTPRSEGSDPDFFLKQRMIMFAEQTLDWGRRMKRYAADLPELAAIGLASGESADLRARSIAVSVAHTQGIERYGDKLAENMVHALPKATRRFRPRDDAPNPSSSLPPPVDGAVQVASAARSIARRVFRFIHPMNHTVGLVDLREPSLLDSFKTLRHMTSDYQRSVGKPAR
jgi:hypothetical protein